MQITSSSSFATSTSGQDQCTSIAAVHWDIIATHILTRLDGPTLASTACASSMLHALCTEQKLWKDMCTSTWSSINDPRVRHVISTFPASYRSFFSDSFPNTFQSPYTTTWRDHIRSSPTSELISAVDIRYNNNLICSKVEITETVTNAFLAPPLWIDLLSRKEAVPVPLKFETDNDDFLKLLEESMILSWIMIDPTRKRAANMSSMRPVSVRRHSTAEEVQLLYVTVLPGDRKVGSSEPVQCRILVTCGGEEGGEMHVREVNMQVQDMDGINLSGEDSLVILQKAMGCERRKVGKGGERYEEYMEIKRERRERNQRREKKFDMIFCTIVRFIIFTGLICALCGY
ncbi:hypothetical protein LguiA_012455 [Lonicera macranthoides]